jgi:hypothetical protein
LQIEQLAYPLDGHPQARRGDRAMVLFQRVKATNLEARERKAPLRMTHGREFPEDRQFNLAAMTQDDQLLIEETGSHNTLMSVEARGQEAKGVNATFNEGPASKDAKRKVIRRSMDVTFSSSFRLRLASSLSNCLHRWQARVIGPKCRLDYASARRTTLSFGRNISSRRSIQVPEKAVNDLFRANLWHATVAAPAWRRTTGRPD